MPPLIVDRRWRLMDVLRTVCGHGVWTVGGPDRCRNTGYPGLDRPRRRPVSIIQHNTRPIDTLPISACPGWCTAGHSAALVPDAVDVHGSALFTHRALVLVDDPDGRRIDLVATSDVRPGGLLEHEAPA